MKKFIDNFKISLISFVAETKDTVKEMIKLEWNYERKTFIAIMLFGVLILNTLRMSLQTIIVIINLSYYKVYILNSFAAVFNFLLCLIPFGVWIWSTTEEFFYYRRRKMCLFYYCFINIAVIFLRYVVVIVCNLIVPLVFKITPGEAITVSMLVWTCRIIVLIVVMIFVAFIATNFINILKEEEFRRKIIYFKIDQFFDFRENKDSSYDQNIVKDSETGKSIIYQFKERFMHQLFQGPSGVGKTSAIVKMIFGDFIQKNKNKEERHKEYIEMIKKGEAYLPEKNGEIDPENICAFSGYEDKLRAIKEKYPDCGYTCIGPDTDLSDKVVEFCKLFDIDDYYLCDPEMKNGKFKEHYKGINPYHLSGDVSEHDFPIEVATISRRVADVLQSVFDESGMQDVYFESVNTTCTTNISTILMAGMPFSEDKREPKLTDLSSILMRFDRIRPYLSIVKQRYIDEKGDNKFRQAIDFVENEMLGNQKDAQELWRQARGLRNILDMLLSIPNIAATLCADEPIDFKEVLDNGKVVLVNYGLDYGRSVAKGLGLFYVMTFHEEVKRRSLDSYLMPHFEVVDEFSILMHSCWEESVTLLRKYGLSCTFAFQSLAQFKKNKSLEYMAEVIRGVGQMTIFGRTDDVSAKIFTELAGKEKRTVTQDTVNWNSLLEEEPNYSESQRTTQSRENYVDAADLRNTDFLEAHIFSVKNGRTLPPVLGKMYFVTKKEKKKVKVHHNNWNKYVLKRGSVLTNSPADIEASFGENKFFSIRENDLTSDEENKASNPSKSTMYDYYHSKEK